jgi:PEGA domain
MAHHWFGLVTAMLLTFTALGSFAQSVQEQPRNTITNSSAARDAQVAKLRTEAEAFVKADDCDGAMGPLRSAWALKEDASIAIMLGECELELRKDPDGAHHLARAVDLLPNGAERKRIELILRDVASRLTRLEVTANEPGTIVVVDNLVTQTPVKDFFAQPGLIRVTAKKTGFVEETKTVDAKAGQTVTVAFMLKTRSTSLPFTTSPIPSATTALPVYLGIGAGVISLGLGVGLRVAGTNRDKEANDILIELPGDSPCCGNEFPEDCKQIVKLRGESDRLINTSTGLFVAGGILLVGTAVYGYVRSGQTSSELAFLPIVSPGKSGLLLQGRF